MHTPKVYAYLKQHGQLLSSEIATATGIAIYEVHAALSELSAQGEISKSCMTRSENVSPEEKYEISLAS